MSHQSMKLLIVELGHVNWCRVPGWVLRDYLNEWLEIATTNTVITFITLEFVLLILLRCANAVC